ncbi:hypothetical protein B0J11DRAFT_334194 [Dendryphion nanum]|uniref:MYND-type domain-containing protein n=1 Tax=Dendryphion nanum TaxID=256645 RepID=A0A9P9DN08_9PLEO|nr:hypothetical protein B0J11DRAFT_334194 [Dendryphion nanum]
MASTIKCFWCQTSPEDKGRSEFSRCSRCKSLQYCSSACQRTDWSHHKTECRAISEGKRTAPLSRASISTNTLATSTVPNPDAVYYIKTSIPSTRDISLMGPYWPLDSITQRIRQRLSEFKSAPGVAQFEETLKQTPIFGIEKLVAPLAAGGGTAEFEIIQMKRPEVAEFLLRSPQEPDAERVTYTVYEHTPDLKFPYSAAMASVDFIPVLSLVVHDVFLEQDEAMKAARTLLRELEDQAKTSGKEMKIFPTDEDTFLGAIVGSHVNEKYVIVQRGDGKAVVEPRRILAARHGRAKVKAGSNPFGAFV